MPVTAENMTADQAEALPTVALASRLANPNLLPAAGLIDGEWILQGSTQRYFSVTNPSNGDEIARLPDLGRDETQRAIDAAYIARPSWAALTAKERCQILRRWNDLIVANSDDLAAIVTSEMGKPLAEAKGEVLYGASFIEWFAEEAKRVYGDTIPGHQLDKRLIAIRQPVGVVGAITPWNFPVAMITRKVAPALAVGCSVIIKPAKQSPLSAIALCALARQAGIPDGIINLVIGTDGPGVGQELCGNDKVRKITFTGSTEVGRILMRQCADQIKKVSLELGGNAPFIVFEDADLDAAVEGAIISKYRNSGQTCVCANRIYVHDAVYDAFAAKLAAKVEAMSVGDGFAEGTAVGPLIDQAGLRKVEEHVSDAVDKGAQILTGGRTHQLGGLFFQPTILTEVTKEMKISREETFGPVAPLFRFSSTEEVIALANDTEFGLASYFYGRDIGLIWQVAEALEYGMVGVNTGLISTELAPFGGVKQSGLGREGSKYGIEDFVELKYICLSL